MDEEIHGVNWLTQVHLKIVIEMVSVSRALIAVRLSFSQGSRCVCVYLCSQMFYLSPAVHVAVR